MAAPTQFTIEPGGPVSLVVGGDKGNPGVQVRNTGGGVAPQTVRVTLPSGGILRFVPEGVPSRFVLSVWNQGRGLTLFYADENPAVNPAPTSLTVRSVDLGVDEAGAVSAVWVSVQALQVPPDTITVAFNVGGLTSNSGEIDVSRS
ncbi:hypothetical protein ACFWF7_15675 [Nocardia sp. NPDC060256]|uniref:hypothetical protein n=1 Tax=unclassified Nocardia TaxID=2637762 RepID=UPI00365DAB88